MAAFSRNTLSRYTTGIPSPPSLPRRGHYSPPPPERLSQKGDGQNKSRPAEAGRLGAIFRFGKRLSWDTASPGRSPPCGCGS